MPVPRGALGRWSEFALAFALLGFVITLGVRLGFGERPKEHGRLGKVAVGVGTWCASFAILQGLIAGVFCLVARRGRAFLACLVAVALGASALALFPDVLRSWAR